MKNQWIGTKNDRFRLVNKIMQWPLDKKGFYVTIKGPSRSLKQNALMWSLLGQISKRVIWHGSKYEPEDWKVMLTKGWLKETRPVQCVTGRGYVDLSGSTSRLTVPQMKDLIEFIFWFGSEQGVKFRENKEKLDEVNGVKEAA